MKIESAEMARSNVTQAMQAAIKGLHVERGVAKKRMAHINQVTDNLLRLKAGNTQFFYDAMLPEDRVFEDEAGYKKSVEKLHTLLAGLPGKAERLLEIGTRLHDIGYSMSDMPDHCLYGAEIMEAAGTAKKIGLSDTEDIGFVSDIIRYHGLFTDIGLSFRPETLTGISDTRKRGLAIITFLDSTAKQNEKDFYSIAYSRLIDRIFQILGGDIKSLKNERIRQVFGPISYCWLNDRDYSEVLACLKGEGVTESKGFKELEERGLFDCWPIFTDILSEGAEFTNSCYIPLGPGMVPVFASFLKALSQVASETEGRGDIKVATRLNSFDSNKRRPLIEEVIESSGSPIKTEGDITRMGSVLFELKQEGRGHKIEISVE